MNRARIFFLTVLILLPPMVEAGALIERQFGSLVLGMTVEAFRKAAPSLELKEAYLNLLPDERFLSVMDVALPKGVVQLTGRFYRDRLYKISVEYARDGFDEEAWTSMVSRQMERYGKVPIQRQPIGERINEIIRWDDGSTVLILQRELRMRFEQKKLVKSFGVFVTYLDQSVWKERLEAEMELLPGF